MIAIAFGWSILDKRYQILYSTHLCYPHSITDHSPLEVTLSHHPNQSYRRCSIGRLFSNLQNVEKNISSLEEQATSENDIYQYGTLRDCLLYDESSSIVKERYDEVNASQVSTDKKCEKISIQLYLRQSLRVHHLENPYFSVEESDSVLHIYMNPSNKSRKSCDSKRMYNQIGTNRYDEGICDGDNTYISKDQDTSKLMSIDKDGLWLRAHDIDHYTDSLSSSLSWALGYIEQYNAIILGFGNMQDFDDEIEWQIINNSDTKFDIYSFFPSKALSSGLKNSLKKSLHDVDCEVLRYMLNPQREMFAKPNRRHIFTIIDVFDYQTILMIETCLIDIPILLVHELQLYYLYNTSRSVCNVISSRNIHRDAINCVEDFLSSLIQTKGDTSDSSDDMSISIEYLNINPSLLVQDPSVNDPKDHSEVNRKNRRQFLQLVNLLRSSHVITDASNNAPLLLTIRSIERNLYEYERIQVKVSHGTATAHGLDINHDNNRIKSCFNQSCESLETLDINNLSRIQYYLIQMKYFSIQSKKGVDSSSMLSKASKESFEILLLKYHCAILSYFYEITSSESDVSDDQMEEDVYRGDEATWIEIFHRLHPLLLKHFLHNDLSICDEDGASYDICKLLISNYEPNGTNGSLFQLFVYFLYYHLIHVLDCQMSPAMCPDLYPCHLIQLAYESISGDGFNSLDTLQEHLRGYIHYFNLFSKDLASDRSLSELCQRYLTLLMRLKRSSNRDLFDSINDNARYDSIDDSMDDSIDDSYKRISISSQGDALVFIFVDQSDCHRASRMTQYWRSNCHHQLCSLFMRFFVFPFPLDQTEEIAVMYAYSITNKLIHQYCSNEDVIVLLIGLDEVLAFSPPGVRVDCLIPPVEYGKAHHYGLTHPIVFSSINRDKSYYSLSHGLVTYSYLFMKIVKDIDDSVVSLSKALNDRARSWRKGFIRMVSRYSSSIGVDKDHFFHNLTQMQTWKEWLRQNDQENASSKDIPSIASTELDPFIVSNIHRLKVSKFATRSSLKDLKVSAI